MCMKYIALDVNRNLAYASTSHSTAGLAAPHARNDTAMSETAGIKCLLGVGVRGAAGAAMAAPAAPPLWKTALTCTNKTVFSCMCLLHCPRILPAPREHGKLFNSSPIGYFSSHYSLTPKSDPL